MDTVCIIPGNTSLSKYKSQSNMQKSPLLHSIVYLIDDNIMALGEEHHEIVLVNERRVKSSCRR